MERPPGGKLDNGIQRPTAKMEGPPSEALLAKRPTARATARYKLQASLTGMSGRLDVPIWSNPMLRFQLTASADLGKLLKLIAALVLLLTR